MTLLRDVVDVQPKSRVKAGDGLSCGKYKFFTSSNIQTKWLNEYQYDKPALIFGTGGMPSVHFCDTPFSTSTDCVVMYSKTDMNLAMVYYYLSSNMQLLDEGFHGIGLKHISKDYILNFEIPEMNEQTQYQIVATADMLTNIVDLRKQQLAKLDELVKSQFIEMFGSSAKDYRNWPVKKIEDMAESLRTGPFGSDLLHSEFVDSGVFVLGIDNAVENRFSYNRMRFITEEKYEKLKRYTVYSGDVIITIMGTVGRSAVIPDEFPKAINTKHLACLTLNRNIVDPYFICYAFQQHPSLLEQLHLQSKGAIMDGLNLTIIKNLQIALPPLILQRQFSGFYLQVDKSKGKFQKSLATLETLKKALMQQYFE